MHGKITLHDCIFKLGNFFSSFYFGYGSYASAGEILFENCIFYHSTTSAQSFFANYYRGGHIKWKNCRFPSIGKAFNFLGNSAVAYGLVKLTIEDTDLSLFTGVLFSQEYDTNVSALDVTIRRCTLPNNPTYFANNVLRGGDKLRVEYSGPTGMLATPLGLNYYQDQAGTTIGDTSVYRTATDGENYWSYKLVSVTTNIRSNPLYLVQPFLTWHRANGAKNLTIYFGSTDSALKDNDVVLTVSTNSRNTPAWGKGYVINTQSGYGLNKAANSGTYLKSDSSTWTGSGPSTFYKIQVTGITCTEPGPMEAVISLHKENTTIWVCPNFDWV
jgi:hypothetical protein